MEADGVFNHGLKRARGGDYAGALFSLRQAAMLEGDGARAETYRLLGKVCVGLGDVKQAEDCFRRALAIEPGDSGAALCLDVLRRYQYGRRILAFISALAAAAAALAALWYPWQAYRRNMSALPSAQTALTIPEMPSAKSEPPEVKRETPKIQPKEPRVEPARPAEPFAAQYQKALEAALRGDLRRALPLLQELSGDEYAKEPLAGNTHFWLGRCLYELGMIQAALVHFQRVLEFYPGSPKAGDALLDAGRCYRRLKNEAKAEEMWKKLLDGPYDFGLKALAAKQAKQN